MRIGKPFSAANCWLFMHFFSLGDTERPVSTSFKIPSGMILTRTGRLYLMKYCVSFDWIVTILKVDSSLGKPILLRLKKSASHAFLNF